MARIFNIYFTYEDDMHHAVVSVRKTPFLTEYSLINFNEELLQLLPGNKIVSRSPDEFIFQNVSGENNSALMDAITRAVAEHMHATQA